MQACADSAALLHNSSLVFFTAIILHKLSLVTTYSDAKFTTLGKGKVSQLLKVRFIMSPFEQYQQYSDIRKVR